MYAVLLQVIRASLPKFRLTNNFLEKPLMHTRQAKEPEHPPTFVFDQTNCDIIQVFKLTEVKYQNKLSYFIPGVNVIYKITNI